MANALGVDSLVPQVPKRSVNSQRKESRVWAEPIGLRELASMS
jgi:hypothetical protein